MYRKSILLFSFVSLLGIAANFASADMMEGLLVRYDFDDFSDSSGNGYDAVPSGDAYCLDGLLHLDGDDDYVDVAEAFNPVNPMGGGSDFTIAIAYACSNDAEGTENGNSMLVGVSNTSGASDNAFSLITNNNGQYLDIWGIDSIGGGDQSSTSFADGTVHWAILTYETASSTFTLYGIDAIGTAIEYSTGAIDYNVDYSDYTTGIGYHPDDGVSGDMGFIDLEGQIDAFAIYNRILTLEEMAMLPESGSAKEKAGNPNPAHEQEDVPLGAELSWNPGIYAATHNVYFGADFDDVNDAGADSDLLVSPGQTGTSYDPPDLLDWGRTYYWRIDEVNAPATPGLHKGKTWSFTIESYAYDMAFGEQIIAVTASSFDQKYDPNNTINSSGLDANDLHDVNEFNMWLSDKSSPDPAWIQYQFDRPYKLNGLLVWNYNRFREDRLGYGFKEALIEYSMDGIEFTALDPIQFEPATGEESIGPITVALNGLVATHVRLRAISNFKGRSQYGLSEVRLLYLPVRAREPEPADGAENVLPGIPLRWRAGREVEMHDVLIGTDMNDLTLVGDDITEAGFVPDLVLSEMYYWQVLETDVVALAGDIWSFSTQDYLVLDDFESYNTSDKQIWEMWLDGFGFGMPGTPYFNPGNGTGSAVGDESSPSYMEETIVHSGSKSVPLAYNNSVASISEITAKTSDLSINRDWTRANIKALTLYIHGSEGNLGGQLYVKVNDVRKDQSADLTGEYWQEVNIDLASFGVDLQSVTSLTIGIAGAGSTGLVYIDDIRLYPSRCIPEKVPGDLTGDCIVDEEDLAVIADNWLRRPLSVEYTFDTGLSDTSGNNRHGVGQNNPTVANGILTLNGTNFVDIPLGSDNPFDGSRDFSISMDFKTNIASILLSSARDDERDNHSMSVFVHHWDQPYSGEVLYDNYTVGAATVEDDPVDGQWHNVVVTYDVDSEWFIVYLDRMAGEAVEMNPAIPGIAADTVRIGGSLNGAYPYNEDAEDLVGDVDNIRIFNFTLTLEDILRLPAIPTAPADLNGDGIVNQADKDIVEANMGPEKLWP